ncbi:MAG: translocation protein S66 [Watsoniomyces obsoletus]|nr:MAG: translocation protein S66 [Watsoniomyces obsoletus]
MPKVLVIGATGNLGGALCSALLRSGHTVYGLARNAAKAKTLSTQEVLPILGSVQDSQAYLSLISSAPIDVVVDASGAADGSNQLLSDLKSAGQARLETAKKNNLPLNSFQKLGFIYTSGMWVHGNSLEQVSDLDPVSAGGPPISKLPAATIVGWRPQLEHDVLASTDVLDVGVLRPSLMYGKTSSVWAMLLAPILEAVQKKENSVEVLFDPGCMQPLAHVEDVAEAYVKMVEKVHVFAQSGVSPVFDLQTSWENMGVVLNAFARSVGFNGEIKPQDPFKTENVFAQAMSTSVKGDSRRARQLLGWDPKRLEGFAAKMEVYGGAFKAGMS